MVLFCLVSSFLMLGANDLSNCWLTYSLESTLLLTFCMYINKSYLGTSLNSLLTFLFFGLKEILVFCVWAVCKRISLLELYYSLNSLAVLVYSPSSSLMDTR